MGKVGQAISRTLHIPFDSSLHLSCGAYIDGNASDLHGLRARTQRNEERKNELRRSSW